MAMGTTAEKSLTCVDRSHHIFTVDTLLLSHSIDYYHDLTAVAAQAATMYREPRFLYTDGAD